jgi:hypothetical protein
MKVTKQITRMAFACLLTIFAITTFAAGVKPALPPAGFKNQYATVNGVKLHYVIGGKGQPLLLVSAKTGICGTACYPNFLNTSL